MQFFLVLFLVNVFSFYCEGLTTGHVITLNECGKYPQYQKWILNKDNTLRLSSFTNICLACSDLPYCGAISNPITLNCNSSSNTQTWNTIPINNSKAIQIKPISAGNCIESIGAESYAMTQMMGCNTGYGNNIYQQYLINSNNDNYIRSNTNNSLCLTAAYYPSINCSLSPYNTYPYCNKQLPTKQRINDLISRMTIYEKISNLVAFQNIGIPRLGVPPNKVVECLHGVRSECGKIYNNNTGCPSSFPHALLLSATFNRSLWRHIGAAISDEARALYNQNIGGIFCLSPNINLFRDPRWGRGQETPGEDPFLTGQYGMEYIGGMQYGEDTKYLKTSCTVKHFADYDFNGGRYGIISSGNFNGNVSDKDQFEFYFPAWRTVIQNAKARSLMCSYPAINSKPQCGDNYFMNDIARNEWGFNGFIMSDDGAIGDGSFTRYIQSINNGTNNILLNIKIAMESGCDVNDGATFTAFLYDAIQQNYVSTNTVNNALYRFLETTIDLGLIDIPGPIYNQYNESYVDTPKHRQLSLDASMQGIVLLKNINNTLPLKNIDNISYGFIGPHFNSTQYLLSNYIGTNTLVNSHSPYQAGIQRGLNIKYAQGCDLGCNSTDGFNEAINVAKQVDICIVFLGLYAVNFAGGSTNSYSQALEAEGFDRENVTFPGLQLQLLQEIYSANNNTILILINASPIDLTWPKNNIPAIIESFYPGQLGGDAIISILFGDKSPAGKLPITLYDASITNRAITDMSLSSNGGITYRYYKGEPVYPFGYGLAYTTFEYKYFNNSDSSNRINTKYLYDCYINKDYKCYHDTTSFIVQVTNIGNMDSDCVVLGFVTYDNNSPNIKLFDFQRVFVLKGESINVTLSISPQSISIVNTNGVEYIMPNKYNIYLGDYQTNKNYVKTEIQLIGDKQLLFDPSKYQSNE